MGRVGMTTSGGMFIPIGVTIDEGSVTKTKAYLDKFRAAAEKDGTIELKIDYNQAKGAKTQIETLKLATGEYVKVLSQLNSEGIPVKQTIVSMGNSAKTAANGFNQLNSAAENVNKTTKHSVSIFQDFTNTFLKMAKFNTINLIYDGMINKMSEAIEITNDFDKAMTEFKKVTDTSAISLSDYTEELGKLGELTATTTTEMVQAATEFSKGGFSPEDSAKLAQVANLYMNIADAEISAGEASSYVISQMKAFDMGVEDAINIIDKTNEVSNSFAVSSTDIASALTKQSASLAAYGNSIDESIALNAI